MTKAYEITVKILVSIPDADADAQAQYDEAMIVARCYADMALRYKSIGADAVLDIIVEPKNVK